MAKRAGSSGRRKRGGTGRRRGAWRIGAVALLLAVAAGVAGLWHLDHSIRTRFEGRRWALAARVFARPLELYEGAALGEGDLLSELRRLRYRAEPGAPRPGTFEQRTGAILLHTRPFSFWDGVEPERRLHIAFAGPRLARLTDPQQRRTPGPVRLDPPLVGSIYPADGEDRLLVRLADVPELLPQALLSVEDRNFYRHPGVDLRAVGRALWANLRAGAVVQGGSTITQQLVKNYFLSAERTFTRKATEALMALLLERRYSKAEILEAYLNEIYMGQDAARAVHGVGLASQFYFDRPVAELDLARIALLVGLVRGPSQYDPRRHPERARERRNQVLGILAERGVVSAAAARAAGRAPLGVSAEASSGASPYPAFLDLVKRQLRSEYREEDLRSEGLRIFTSLEPRVQEAAQGAVTRLLERLNARRPAGREPLQAALVLTRTGTGEVLAVVGAAGRGGGFNRALDARRPIGSLVKPAVYLTALEQPDRYTLASEIDDGPLEVDLGGGRRWSPDNFDGRSHGRVTLYEALVRSYNRATVRLGLELGVDTVVATMGRLGVDPTPAPYPSALLGAFELSPFELAGMYHTLASGGFRTRLRAVAEVLDPADRPLRRYPVAVRQVVEPGPAYLVESALRGVVSDGTARPLARHLPAGPAAAGKTGTTDGLRDSWFAGFTGDWLGVAWLGCDANDGTGLTGASGALELWAEVYRRIGGAPLAAAPPAGVELAWVDGPPVEGDDSGKREPVSLPFLTGSVPAGADAGVWGRPRRILRGVWQWLRGEEP